MPSHPALIKEALDKHGYAVVGYSGISMYPTLKEGMKIKITKVSPLWLRPSDIIVYVQENTIIAHRLIRILSNGEMITKGDHQPFGGLDQIKESDLLGRAISAFYENNPEKNFLVKNWLIDFFYVFMGRAFLVYEKIKKYIPKPVKIFLKYLVRNLYCLFQIKYQKSNIPE
jgi:signal peptidase I